MIPDYLSIEDDKQKELILTYYLAPVMLKVKPASLLAFATTELMEYEELIRVVGIKKMILDEYHNKSYVLFYHEDMVRAVLREKDNQDFLKKLGYTNYQMQTVLYRIEVDMQLCHRKNKSELFPHEIGLLLGYPLQDVIGYMRNHGQEALENGYWKVYGNVARAKSMFSLYDQAKKTMLQYVTNHSLLEFHM